MSSSPLNEQLVSLLHCWYHDLNQQFHRGRSNLNDLTLLQLWVLVFVKKQTKVTMSDIAKEFAITKASATSLIERLVKSKWLKRSPDGKDRRLVYITLTPSGIKKLHSAKQARLAILNDPIDTLSEHDKHALLRILKLITSSK